MRRHIPHGQFNTEKGNNTPERGKNLDRPGNDGQKVVTAFYIRRGDQERKRSKVEEKQS